MGLTPRAMAWLKWGSWLLIAGSLIAVVTAVPVDTAVERLQSVVDSLGSTGYLVFGAAYVLAAVLFVPGSALTLAAGALFGLVTGTIVVWLAATTAAALAFLIARYLARDKVAVWAAGNRRFSAIDRAIGKGDWRIIAMLRLVPVFPFSLGNYLLGLTAIRFVPYLLASWVCMLPGTFMYVYFGSVARQATEISADRGLSEETGKIMLWIVGGLAAVGVVIYLTKLVRRALEAEIGPDDPAVEPDGATHGTSPRVVWVSLVLAVLSLGLAANRDRIPGLFGPPVVTLAETYEGQQGTGTFDHKPFDALLRKHVDAEGYVDYAALKKDPAALDTYIAALGKAKFEDLGRDGKLTLLINAYNAFTLRLILDHMPLKSINDIPDAERWNGKRWKLLGKTLSLNDIEHQEIRKHFEEPRIHFALVCAAIGCPKLRNEAYTAKRLEEQLEDQTRYVHRHDRWFRFDADQGVVYLTQLYNWYGDDFKQVAGTVLDFAARYSPALKKALAAGQELELRWLDYDWNLNTKTSR